MIEATKSQKERIQQLLDDLLGCVEEFWRLPAGTAERDFVWPLHNRDRFETDENLAAFRKSVFERLQDRYDDSFLDQGLADLLFNPTETPFDPPPGCNFSDITFETRMQGGLVRAIAYDRFLERPSEYSVGLLAERLRHQLAHPWESCERPATQWPANGYYEPDLKVCMQLLERLTETPATRDLVLPIVEDLLRGNPNVGLVSSAPEHRDPESSYRTHYQELRSPLDQFLRVVHAAGRLDYDLFENAARNAPSIVWFAKIGPEAIQDRSSYQACYNEFVRRYAWELCQGDLADEDAKTVERFEGYSGARYLLKVCEHIEAFKLKSISPKGKSRGAALAKMAKLDRLDPDDDETEVVERLRQFKPRTLKAVLPHADAGEDLVRRALKDEGNEASVETKSDGGKELTTLIRRIAHPFQPGKFTIEGEFRDIPNSPSQTEGVIPIAEVLAAAEKAGGANMAKETIAELRKAGLGLSNTLKLAEAVLDLNRASILKSIEKRNQPAVKAYGLLPIQRGEDEILERYRFFKEYAKGSVKFGSQRQANERGAAQVGLANLAQNAGYLDVSRLEWAMEARVADETEAASASQQVGDYTIALSLCENSPTIVVERKGKRLKSVPAAVRKSDEFQALRQQADDLKAQHQRFRSSLESLMASGSAIAIGDQQLLARIPVARGMLENLILIDESGEFAFFDPVLADAPAGTVRIAHPKDFFDSGALSDWQREVVRRQTVQPFKQVFRELYVLTPAELETGDFSNRFAGHVVNSRVAGKLFQTRGWQTTGTDGVHVHKAFPAPGIDAHLETPDAMHYLTEQPTFTTDQVLFTKNGGRARLPLASVPPLLFSEVMRDLDLVVSVAHVEDEVLVSSEAYMRRSELLLAIIGSLGLPNVEIDGHFAKVRGELANYRVHLASAAIHIEPGNYLCVVPDKWGRSGKIYLPFAGGDDPKLSEIVSKILLLANDAKITDESIRSQILRT